MSGRLRRQAGTEITLINATDVFVERLRLHQYAANQDIRWRPIRSFLRGKNVQFVQGVVTSIGPAQYEVAIKTAAGTRQIRYDHLLYTLGSTIERARVNGVREYAYTLAADGPRSAAALREALPAVAKRGGQAGAPRLAQVEALMTGG